MTDKRDYDHTIEAEITCESCIWYSDLCSHHYTCDHYTPYDPEEDYRVLSWASEHAEYYKAWLDYIDEDYDIKSHDPYKAGDCY